MKPIVEDDTDGLKLVLEILKTCGNITNEDQCESAGKIQECILQLTEFC
jgi:hypothetical protein